MKFYNKTIITRNAAAPYPSLAERISLRKETHEEFYEEVKEKLAEIECPKQREKYFLQRECNRCTVTHSVSKAEQDRINEKFEEHLWMVEQASRLIMEMKVHKRLKDWISNPTPSLLSCLGPPQHLSQEEVEETYGNDGDTQGKVPKEAGCMQKLHIIDRTKELMNLFNAVNLRLVPLSDHLVNIDKVDKELSDEVSKLLINFEDLYDHFDENKGRKKLKGKHYRWITRDLKKIKYVFFENFGT